MRARESSSAAAIATTERAAAAHADVLAWLSLADEIRSLLDNDIDNTQPGANNMNASQLFADINTGCLTEVAQAANSYYDQNRGLTVHQSFYVYPDDTIVAINYVDGGYQTLTLCGDDAATFSHLYLRA